LAALLDGDGEGVAAAAGVTMLAPSLVTVTPLIAIGVVKALKADTILLVIELIKAVLPGDNLPPAATAVAAAAALGKTAV